MINLLPPIFFHAIILVKVNICPNSTMFCLYFGTRFIIGKIAILVLEALVFDRGPIITIQYLGIFCYQSTHTYSAGITSSDL